MTELLQILTEFDSLHNPSLLGLNHEEQYYLILPLRHNQESCFKQIKEWAHKNHATIKCSYEAMKIRKNGNLLASIIFI